MIERGEFARGVAVLNDAFDACRRTGWRMSYPEFKGALATGLAGLGQLDEALAAVNEGLDGAAQGEHGHDLFFAELLRIKGEILLRREARDRRRKTRSARRLTSPGSRKRCSGSCAPPSVSRACA